MGIKKFENGSEDFVITNKEFNGSEKNIAWQKIPKGSFYLYRKNEEGEFSKILEYEFISSDRWKKNP